MLMVQEFKFTQVENYSLLTAIYVNLIMPTIILTNEFETCYFMCIVQASDPDRSLQFSRLLGSTVQVICVF